MWETWVRSLGWEDPLENGSHLLQYSGLENSMDCIVRGIAKSRTRLSDFHFQNMYSEFRNSKINKVNSWQPYQRPVAWDYFWSLYCVLLLYMSVLSILLVWIVVAGRYFEIRNYEASSFVLLAQNCFGYLWSLVILYKFQDWFFSISVKTALGFWLGLHWICR